MALLTDDCDLNKNRLVVDSGGNGDWYVRMIVESDEGLISINSVRISTSGGIAPTEVKIAIANLSRAMEKHGLNELE